MNEIKISETDFVRLVNLTKMYPNQQLCDELTRAEIIKDILVTPDLVTINSKVVYAIDDRLHESTLVFERVPAEQNLCISVLDELGTALLGMRENQEMEWNFSHGKKLVRVLSVIYQPEAVGDEHPLC